MSLLHLLTGSWTSIMQGPLVELEELFLMEIKLVLKNALQNDF